MQAKFGASGKPGDRRGFVHKRIFGGIKGAVGGLISGGPLGAITGGLGGVLGGGEDEPAPFITPGVVPGAIVQQGCPPGFARQADGGCSPTMAFGTPSGRRIPQTERIDFGPPGDEGVGPQRGRGVAPPGSQLERQIQPGGKPVRGRFGAAMNPRIELNRVRTCKAGMVLGKDRKCYNKRDLRNSERMWPRGRRPLLTGGEMRAVSVASAAAKKLQRKEKQLQELGLLKKPASRSRRAPAQRVPHHHHHDGTS
jgi:hypothetical protein